MQAEFKRLLTNGFHEDDGGTTHEWEVKVLCGGSAGDNGPEREAYGEHVPGPVLGVSVVALGRQVAVSVRLEMKRGRVKKGALVQG